MPERRLQGLRGLKGLNTLSPEERETFMQANANKLSIYKNPLKRRKRQLLLEKMEILRQKNLFLHLFYIKKIMLTQN